MKRNFKLLMLSGAVAMLMTGCSNPSEDIVKQHVEAWGNQDRAEMVKNLSIPLKDAVSEASKLCQTKATAKYKNVIARETNNKVKDLTDKVNEITTKRVDLSKMNLKEVTKERLTSIKQVKEDTFERTIMESILEQSSSGKVSDDQLRDIITKGMEDIQAHYMKNSTKVQDSIKDCNSRVFKVEKFKKVNILENDIKTESPDVKIVRVEIVFESGDTVKYNMKTELKNDKWLITKSNLVENLQAAYYQNLLSPMK